MLNEERRQLGEHIDQLDQQNRRLIQQNHYLRMELNKTLTLIHDIRKGPSWKIGRMVTFIPRRIKKLFGNKSNQTSRETLEIDESQFVGEDPKIGETDWKRKEDIQYQTWFDQHGILSPIDRIKIRQHIDRFPFEPMISILIPIDGIDNQGVVFTIASLQKQIYPHWELIILTTGNGSGVKQALKPYLDYDRRISIHEVASKNQFPDNLNNSLEEINGEFVSLIQPGDLLSDEALYQVAHQICLNPGINLLYGDEDNIDLNGHHSDPFFKPDWNPELLLVQNYLGNPCFFRKTLVQDISGFRTELPGEQDWDFNLRFVEQIPPQTIHHIPRLLCHVHEADVEKGGNLKSERELQTIRTQVLNEALQRRRIKAKTFFNDSQQTYRIKYEMLEEPSVSLIILTRDGLEVLKKCISSILERTRYQNFELIIVDNGSCKEETKNYFKSLAGNSRVRIIKDDAPFNYSALNNRAVLNTKGKILGFVNNDIEVRSGDWMSEMVSHAGRKEIGAIGARLMYPDGKLQHGGVISGIRGVAGHACHGFTPDRSGRNYRYHLSQNISIVTAACMFIRREVFEEVRGFNEKDLAVAFNDVDFCLRVRQAGYLNLYTPHVDIIHHESYSRGEEDTPEKQERFRKEIEYIQSQWGDILQNDPYYNPNLTLDSDDFSLSAVPRYQPPWDF